MTPTPSSTPPRSPVGDGESMASVQLSPAIADRLAPSAPDAARPPRGPGVEARRRVLVVDDDSLIGRYVANVLDGYEVVFAQSAAGALGRVASGRGFAAIVCDLHMPGMDGIRFHEEIERIAPELGRRILFVTGWADAPAFVEFRKRTGCAWLPKPFAPAALRAAVDRACAVD